MGINQHYLSFQTESLRSGPEKSDDRGKNPGVGLLFKIDVGLDSSLRWNDKTLSEMHYRMYSRISRLNSSGRRLVLDESK